MDIVAKDEAGNETIVEATLNVTSTAVASLYLVCLNNNSGVIDKLGLVESKFNKVATRIYTFTFSNLEEYNSFKNENKDKSEITYKDVTGKPSFVDDDLKLQIEFQRSYDDLNAEFETTLPLAYADLRSFYEDKGYTCNIGY